MRNRASCVHAIITVKQPDRSVDNNRYFYKHRHLVFWWWNNSHWNISVMNAIMADAAKEGSAQCANPTRAHHNKLCVLIFRQFADHFSWIVAFLLVQLEIQLKQQKEHTS